MMCMYMCADVRNRKIMTKTLKGENTTTIILNPEVAETNEKMNKPIVWKINRKVFFLPFFVCFAFEDAVK